MPTLSLSVTEVAALLDIDEKVVRKEIEHRVIREAGESAQISFAEVVYLSAMARLGLQLGVEDRRSVRRRVDSWLRGSRRGLRVAISPVLDLRIGAIATEVATSLTEFRAWKARRVVEDPQILAGEPVLKGTRLSVRKLGEMLAAHGERAAREIREDYRSVTADDLRFAPRFARAYPRRGRPRHEAAP